MKKTFLALILLFVIHTQQMVAQDVSQWRGPERNGFFPDKGLLKSWPAEGPELLWRYDGLGLGYSSVAIANNQIYTAGTIDSINYIFSFNFDGRLNWKKKLGSGWMVNYPGVRATPVIYKGLGYLRNGFGVVYCFDANNGNVVWEKDVDKEFDGKYCNFGVAESVAVDEIYLYCVPGGKDANLLALDRKTGDLVWKSSGNGEPNTYSSPVLFERGGNKYIAAVTTSSLFAVNTQNGELAWKHDLGSKQCSNTPIYKDGIIYVSLSEKGIALKLNEDGSDYQPLWENNDFMIFQGDAVLVGEKLYAHTGKYRTLRCIDWKTGKEISSEKLDPKFQIASLIFADKRLYWYSYLGNMRLFSVDNNKFVQKGSFDLPVELKNHCSYMVIHDGKLFVRYQDTLLVYNISNN